MSIFPILCPVGMSVGDACIDSSVGTGPLAFVGKKRGLCGPRAF